MKILVVEDNLDLLNDTVKYLLSQNYYCEQTTTFIEASEKIELYNYDLFIIDISLPDGSGLELIKLIKLKNIRSGVIIVTARDAVEDKINGLNLGADDYLTKPFHKEELNARIKSIIRRNKFKGDNLVTFNEIKVDLNSAQVYINNSEIVLTKKEYDLLLYFIDNVNRILTKENIAEHLWGDHFDQADNFDFIYNHIKNLRKKMINNGGTDYIKSLYGMGYKFGK